MKAVIYSRVSVIRATTDSASPEVQDERCKSYIKAQGWQYTKKYEDLGISGRDINRPAFQQMLKGAEAGLFDCIVVYKLDRISRNVRDFHNLVEKLDSLKISLVSVTQHIDTSSPSGRLLRSILMDFANFERELISERMIDGKYLKAKQGYWQGGVPPLGYKSVGKRGQRSLKVTKDIALPRRIFNLYPRLKSQRKVARELETTLSRVQTTLRNPVYAGYIVYGRRRTDRIGRRQIYADQSQWQIAKGTHRAIVSFKRWQEIQRLMKSLLYMPQHRKTLAIFSKKAYCGRCKRILYLYIGHSKLASGKPVIYTYYRCYNQNLNKKQSCGFGIKEEKLEKSLFQGILLDLLGNKDFWEKAITKTKITSIKKKRAECQKQLQSVKAKIKRLVTVLVDKEMPADEIKPELIRLEELKKNLELKLLELEERPIKKDSLELMRNILFDLRANYNKMSTDEKREIVDILIDRIYLLPTQFTIHWRDKHIPPSTLKYLP